MTDNATDTLDMGDNHAIRIADGEERVDFPEQHNPHADLAALFGHSPDTPTDSLVAAARYYLDCRARKEDNERLAKDLGERLGQAETELLRKLDEAGVLSVKVETTEGKSAMISAATSTHYRLPSGHLEDSNFMLWLLRNGGQDMVRRTVHHATFSSFCREIAEQGKTIPSPVVATTMRTLRVLRK